MADGGGRIPFPISLFPFPFHHGATENTKKMKVKNLCALRVLCVEKYLHKERKN